MKQVLLERYGAPAEAVRCVEVPDVGAPAPGEVVFDVLAFPINPADLSMCRGTYRLRPALPAGIGAECVGRVAAVGDQIALYGNLAESELLRITNLCGVLDRMNYEQDPSPPLYRVDAVELDHGPDGHADLFGSVWEWTRSQGYNLCGLVDGAPDFVTVPSTGDVWDTVGFATPIIHAIGAGKDTPMRAWQVGTNRYNIGFRCAFDSPPL